MKSCVWLYSTQSGALTNSPYRRSIITTQSLKECTCSSKIPATVPSQMTSSANLWTIAEPKQPMNYKTCSKPGYLVTRMTSRRLNELCSCQILISEFHRPVSSGQSHNCSVTGSSAWLSSSAACPRKTATAVHGTLTKSPLERRNPEYSTRKTPPNYHLRS